ncbi:glycerol dehydrogenase [Corynebacterium qintianiae]|uniref:glycerol dehydrogenase n=1 Tax=Corynebacterium qintianiae TaxID=2709392 RepID=UPI0013EAAE71|nr:glycerol dehydrogenase [Corynebacterium qintianiae]
MDMGRWVIAIAGAVVGALFFGWLLHMLGVGGILYTVLVLVGSAATSSLAGTIFKPR